MGQERTGTMTTRLELGAERPGLRLGFTLVELTGGDDDHRHHPRVPAHRGRTTPAAAPRKMRPWRSSPSWRGASTTGSMRSCRPGPTPTWRIFTWPVFTPRDHGYRTAGPMYSSGSASTRAQVFAWYDYIKSELPDVFFVQNHDSAAYPLNFAANRRHPGTPAPDRPAGPGQLHVAARQLGRGATECQRRLRRREPRPNTAGHGHLRRVVLRGRGDLQEPGLPADRL